VVPGAQVRDLSREYDKLHRVIESKESQLENLLVLEHTNKQVSAHSPSTVSMLTGKGMLTLALGRCAYMQVQVPLAWRSMFSVHDAPLPGVSRSFRPLWWPPQALMRRGQPVQGIMRILWTAPPPPPPCRPSTGQPRPPAALLVLCESA
jgi:hypothetical protein